MVGIIVAIVLVFFGVTTLLMTFFTVSQQEVKIVQRLGKFARVAGAGLNFKIPWIEYVAGTMSLRIQQLDVKAETKTKDNVFVNVPVSVQYAVMPAKVFDAFYKLSDPQVQITSYVYDVVRAKVPTLLLDEVYEKKDEIAGAIKDALSEIMDDFGYQIIQALVTDVEPAKVVRDAMNNINAAQRNRAAALEQGEADKILVVKRAEADAESKRLQGEGTAAQRKAIIEGLKESIQDFEQGVPGATAADAMALVALTQFLDTQAHVAAASKTNTIFLPNTPGAVGEFFNQIRNSIVTGVISGNASEDEPETPTERAAKTSRKVRKQDNDPAQSDSSEGLAA